MQIAFLAIFGLLWSAGVLFFDGMMARDFFRQVESRHFPAVSGVVTHPEVKTHRGSKGSVSYEAAIEYRYEVGGRTFTGKRWRYTHNSPGRELVSALVAAHPEGSTLPVYYNPNDPADSLLSPDLIGLDFMGALFLTPFNAIMFGFWLGIAASLRERIFRPAAGGMKIIKDALTTRIRMPQYSPIAWALVTTGALGFVFVFVVGFGTQMNPSMGLILSIIALVYLSGAGVFAWQWLKIQSGIDDLVINKGSRTLDLPQTFGRKSRVTTKLDDIQSVWVEKRIHTSSKGGVSYTYAPTLSMRNADPLEQTLADWSDETRANDFKTWLIKELGL